MDRYHESTTTVTKEAAQRLVDEHKARVWRNPRTIGAKGGRNVKLGPVRRIRRVVKDEQSEEEQG